jgi:hypothetical protein
VDSDIEILETLSDEAVKSTSSIENEPIDISDTEDTQKQHNGSKEKRPPR